LSISVVYELRKRRSFWAALIVTAVLIAYLPALGAGFIWDDDRYVTRNRTLHDSAGLKRIWFEIGATPQYYPLVFTTFWIERRFWGIEQATGYHVTNVLLHAANAVLLWIVLSRLNVPLPWLPALLFGIHPVEVESVAWVTERKNVLSGFFYLAAFLSYLTFCGIGKPVRNPSNSWKYYLLSLIFFVAALFSKTVTCTLPVAIALVLWWKSQSFRWRALLPLVPMILLAIPAGILTSLVERQHVGAQGPEWDLSVMERLLIAGRAVWFYLVSIIAPVNLTFIYPRWSIDSSQAWQYLFPIAAILGIALLWMGRNRFGKAPIVASLFFVGTLAPALGFVNVYPMQFSFVADHFEYLASIGPIAFLAIAASWLARRMHYAIRVALLTGTTLVLMVLTWQQQPKYKNNEALWKDTIQRNPQAWIAHNNLSEPLFARHDYLGAAEQASMAIDLRPGYAPAYNNLGLALEELHRIDEAVTEFRKAIELEPTLPQPRLNLAEQLIAQNDLEGAEHQYAKAVAAAPDFADAHYNYAVLLAMRGRTTDALRESRIACQLNPDDAQSQLLLRKLSATTESR
jgi:tetratricopeptide (TPR) repeat protein